ncbi:hypothetical protein HRbin01_00115 [archaeon HR01]|nr:hypothetical protein HRbin01_00115 [archaeon HR01]
MKDEGLRVVGYVSSMEAGVDKAGIFYRFLIVTVTGAEYSVRMRIPPEWMAVGKPITGVLVKVSDSERDYQIQDLSPYTGLPEAKPQGFERLTVEAGPGVKAILTGTSPDAMASAPVLSESLLKKARALSGRPCYLYFADSPYGKVVVALQSAREYSVMQNMRRFLAGLGD